MDEFARRADDDRLAFINEAAARRDVTPIIIEKDFWVCWTLRRLMEVPVLRDHLTFKGGTSLSKAYGIIERFSEDIDLTIGRDAPLVSETLPPMEDGISGKERERRTKALKAAAQSYVQTIALPELAKAIEASLGTTEDWTVRIDPDDRDAQTILFEYPKLLEYSIGGWGRSYGQSYGGQLLAVVPSEQLVILRAGKAHPAWRDHVLPNLMVAAARPGAKPELGWLYDWRQTTRPAAGTLPQHDPKQPAYWPEERVAGAPKPQPLPRRSSACLTPEAMSDAQALVEKVGSSAFLVWRDGAIEHEWYAAGQGPEARLDPASMHKTVLGLAFGLAQADGFVPDLDAPVSTWLDRKSTRLNSSH